MKRGDCLFVYTDGVTEAKDKSREMFGEERLKEALNLNADASPEELIDSVRRTVSGFVKDAPQFDDITMLSLKYHGNAEKKEGAE